MARAYPGFAELVAAATATRVLSGKRGSKIGFEQIAPLLADARVEPGTKLTRHTKPMH